MPTDPDMAAEFFEDKLQQITDRHIPLVQVRRRSNEDPWITNGIRRRARRKRRLYRRKGRSAAWKRADEALQAEISQRRQDFVEELILDPGKNYYRAIKKLGSPGSKKEWSVRDLFPGKTVEDTGNEILEFFSNVGGDAPPSSVPDVGTPGPNGAGLGEFTEAGVEKLFRDHKKVKSMVAGDPMPHLVAKFPGAFAVPAARIFNAINKTGKWPKRWKKEHVTVIPKCPKPDGLRECRNISCTPYLSKVLEGVLLKKLRGELRADPDQYGGEKGCGAEHMIMEIRDRVLRVMDDGDTAACLLGLDFEKAFNRMDHGQCIRQLEKLGASKESIILVRAFLKDRIMSVTIDGKPCGTRPIIRGSPQGSVLGCLLYCLTTQDLANVGGQARPPVRRPSPRPPKRPEFRDNHPLPPAWDSSPVRFFPGSGSEDSDEFNFWDSSGDGAVFEGHWKAFTGEDGITTFKYIDDTTAFEAVPMSTAVKHFTTGATTEDIHPQGLGNVLASVAENAEDIGMKVNVKKTQLLCISPNNGCITSAAIRAEGTTIRSAPTMRLVGFTFGSSPTAEAHVVAITEDFRVKVWFLFHLRNCGIRGMNLYRLYCCYLRSRIEYLSAAYHSMLLKGQGDQLERLHRYSLRLCFGFEGDITETMANLCIETLGERRQRRVDSFISKAAGNPRFGHWFPLRPDEQMNLRNRRKIQEIRSKTERRHNGPLAYLRRRANDLGITPTRG